MDVIVPGHQYELDYVEDPNEVQLLIFIQKEEDDDGTLVTVVDGTTNEEVIKCLIDRIVFLNTVTWSSYNDEALSGLRNALAALERRTADRKERGVEGTSVE